MTVEVQSFEGLYQRARGVEARSSTLNLEHALRTNEQRHLGARDLPARLNWRRQLWRVTGYGSVRTEVEMLDEKKQTLFLSC